MNVEIDEESFEAMAVVAAGAEHERLWELATSSDPALGGYRAKTARRIPLIVLERKKE